MTLNMTRFEPHAPSWYAATATPQPPRSPLEGEVSADVCIIGAGYSGAWAALRLAERGLKVVVLEANRVGWGASGRNGGQVCTGFARGVMSVEAQVGEEDGKRLFNMCEEAKDLLEERVKRHAIPCDLTWGYLHAATKVRHLDECRSEQAELQRYFYDHLTMVYGDDIKRYVNSPRYIGGVFDARAGHLHPLNYCLGIAQAAEAAGAVIHEGTRARRYDIGQTVTVESDRGKVRAKFLVLACNAYLNGLNAEQGRTIMPVTTFVAATEPLGEERAKSLLPQNTAVADCNFILDYFRRTPDHRLLWGGKASYSGTTPKDLDEQMRRDMVHVFPQLKSVKMDYAWGGHVAITIDRTPHLGRHAPNVYFMQGYSGQGVAMTAITGSIIAEAILGQAERFDLFAKLKHKPFPGGRLLRMPSLVLAMTWFRLKDWL